jgi:hypothetical protein
MNDLVKKAAKISGIGILWVFLLSINVNGRTMFSYANDILVQNSLVRMLDEELAGLWDKVCRASRVTMKEFQDKQEKV